MGPWRFSTYILPLDSLLSKPLKLSLRVTEQLAKSIDLTRTLQIFNITEPHAHLRGKKESHKGDINTETAAALAGGYTTVLGMPNTNPAVIDSQSLNEELEIAESQANCLYGAYLGATDTNYNKLYKASKQACALKVYMNQTHGRLKIESLDVLEKHFKYWKGSGPICVHAEDQTLAVAITLSHLYNQRLHVCHVSQASEIKLIKLAKQKGLKVTCEVTPHHLFLTENDAKHLGPFGDVRPELKTQKDQDALWKYLAYIDCIATDHAPHTREEKLSDNPPPGLPGLETALPLMIQAMFEGRLTQEKLIDMVSTKPAEIFGIHHPALTYTTIDTTHKFCVDVSELKTKCGWSPFTNHNLRGKVRQVHISGELVFNDGEVYPLNHGRSLVMRNYNGNI